MPKTLKKSELDSIIDEVASALSAEAVAESKRIGATLAKAHDGEDTSSELPKDDSATTPPSADDGASASPPSDSSGPPADASDSGPPSDGPPDASASSAPPADASAVPGDDGGAGGDGGGAGDINPQELESAYAQLPLPALQMHYLACRSALNAVMGSDGTADAGAGAADAGAPPPGADAGAPPADAGAPPPDASAPPAMKTEKGTEMPSDEKANGENPLGKSEKDKAIASLGAPRATSKDSALSKSALDAEVKKQLAPLVKAVTDFVERPLRKAIVSTSQVPRANTDKVDLKSLSKSEVLDRVKQVAAKPSLSKADRERLKSFALGNCTVEKVEDLLNTP